MNNPTTTSSGPYDLKRDSSHLLMLECFRRGWAVHYANPASLIVREGRLFVRSSRVDVLETAPYFTFRKEAVLPIKRFRAVLMRKDPPVNAAYLHTTQMLSLAPQGVMVLNPPQILRDWNEKLCILGFPKWIPPTLVTADKNEIARFVRSQGGKAVLKPLDGFGGRGVRRIDGTTYDGSLPVMIQAYLPKISRGEKRIFLVDGHPLGALLKIPASGEFISTPDLGARLVPTRLTAREQRLCRAIGPALKRHGIFFAGIDVIDGYLTEINITSPGLLWEWNEVDNRRHEVEIIDLLDKRLRRR